MSRNIRDIVNEIKDTVGEVGIDDLFEEFDTCLESKVEEIEDYLFEKYCVEGDSKISSILLGDKKTTTTLYWSSALIKENDKVVNIATSSGELTLQKAFDNIKCWKENYTVLSAWIDSFDENNSKVTVFHECYVDAIGNIRKG